MVEAINFPRNVIYIQRKRVTFAHVESMNEIK